MIDSAFIWLIAIPLACSPLIYLMGRLVSLRHPGRKTLSNTNGAGGNNHVFPLARWAAFIVLVTSWVPFILSARQYASYGTITIMVDAVPLRMDGLSLLLAAAVLALGTLVVLFSGPYLAGETGEEKYYAMLVAIIGVMIGLGFAGDLFNLWVWFEAMAVTSYLLVVFYREQPASLEAGVKYLVQSATGSILVLLGIALVFAHAGTLHLDEIPHRLQPSPALLAAGALFVIGFGIKVALVPLHTWLPDAHTQAPSGISAMLSGVVIEAGLVAMLRALAALSGVNGHAFPASTWGSLLMGFGALNMFLGNMMALRQIQVKRLLAYSSLSHIGYMILGLGIAIYAGQAAGAQGGMFHLVNHGLMKGLAFLAAGALLFAVSRIGIQGTTTEDRGYGHGPLLVSDLDGAAQRYPLAALSLSLAVLGLGGLPPLAGFMSKWQIFVAGFATHNLVIGLLVVFAALNSVLSLAYYAPLVNAVYRRQPSIAVQQGAPIPALMNLPLVLLALAIIAFGVWPALAQWLVSPAGNTIMAAFGG